jgi:hypothetical protein
MFKNIANKFAIRYNMSHSFRHRSFEVITFLFLIRNLYLMVIIDLKGPTFRPVVQVVMISTSKDVGDKYIVAWSV